MQSSLLRPGSCRIFTERARWKRTARKTQGLTSPWNLLSLGLLWASSWPHTPWPLFILYLTETCNISHHGPLPSFLRFFSPTDFHHSPLSKDFLLLSLLPLGCLHRLFSLSAPWKSVHVPRGPLLSPYLFMLPTLPSSWMSVVFSATNMLMTSAASESGFQLLLSHFHVVVVEL